MPLHVRSAPAPALRSVLAALRAPTAAHQAPALLATGPDGRPPEIELPLPVHELTSLSAPAGASCTRLTGWRFLLREAGAPAGTAAVGAAETLLTSDGWAFAYFCGGPYVASSQRALRQAESLPGRHQPRLLSVPSLYMLALWLHGDADAGITEGAPQPSDLLLPLAPAPPGIAAHVPHRADALLPLLTRRSVPAPGLLRSRA